MIFCLDLEFHVSSIFQLIHSHPIGKTFNVHICVYIHVQNPSKPQFFVKPPIYVGKNETCTCVHACVYEVPRSFVKPLKDPRNIAKSLLYL